MASIATDTHVHAYTYYVHTCVYIHDHLYPLPNKEPRKESRKEKEKEKRDERGRERDRDRD